MSSPSPTLIPFEKLMDVLKNVSPDIIVQYDGMMSSHILDSQQCISAIELKVVFKDEREQPGTDPSAN